MNRSGFEAAEFGDSARISDNAQRRFRVDQQVNSDPPATPKDAREATADQRVVQEQLERQDEDPDGPGLHNSRRNIADEGTR